MKSLVFFPKHLRYNNGFLKLEDSVFTPSQVASSDEGELAVIADGYHVGFELKFDCTDSAIKVKTPASLGLGGRDIYVPKNRLLALWAQDQAALQNIPLKLAFFKDECALLSETYIASLVSQGNKIIDASMLVDGCDLEPGDVVHVSVGSSLNSPRSVVLAKRPLLDGSGMVEVLYALLKPENYVPSAEEWLVRDVNFSGHSPREACVVVEPRKYVELADAWGSIMQSVLRIGEEDSIRYWSDLDHADRGVLERLSNTEELHKTAYCEEVYVSSLLNVDRMFTEQMLKLQLDVLGYVSLPSITVYNKAVPYYKKLSAKRLLIFKHAGKSRYYLRWGIERLWQEKNKGLSVKNLTLEKLSKLLISQYRETTCLVRRK